MATTTSQQQHTGPQRAGGTGGASVQISQSKNRWIGTVVLVLVIAGFLGLGVWGSTALLGTMGGDEISTVKTHQVEKGELIVTVTEDGNVESAVNVDLKCQVAGGSSILMIVEDGKEVKKGEKIVELDSAPIEVEIDTQKITYEKAKAALNSAEKLLVVAKISVDEYLEGIFKKEMQDAQKAITIAMEDLRSAENTLVHSKRMFKKGYVPELELQAQEFAVQRANLELESMKTAKEVLEKYTKKKTVEDLKSQVATAEGNLEAERAAFKLEESKLKRLEEQLGHCIILAPQDGMVVYANEQGRRGSQQPQIEEGAAVRERQTIVRLPDLKNMQVKAVVHETKVESLAAGMFARILIQDRKLNGVVKSIANQPEPGNWFSGNIKEYATSVSINGGDSEGLKPGMTAEVEILVAHLKDVLTLPVGAVVEKSGKYHCWVENGGDEPERRELKIGLTNDVVVQIKEGLEEGEKVLLNPRAVVAEIKEAEEELEEEKVNVKEKFGGEASPPGVGGGRGRAGGQRAGGAQRGGGRGGQQRFEDADKDGDGKLTKEEASERILPTFDLADKNKDGSLDDAEYKAMQRAGVMIYDQDGDGKVTAEELPAERQRLLEFMDSDKDGALTAKEYRDAISRMRQGGGRGGEEGGRGGPGGGRGGFGGNG